MRLGKTKIAIEWLRKIRTRVLVVAPLSCLRTAWATELELERESPPAYLLGAKEQRFEAFREGRKWNLINYEGLLACPELIKDYRWEAVILDESSKIKNPQAQITKLLMKYHHNANRRALLSGTPAPESPLDYACQFIFLRGHFMGFDNFWSFRKALFFTIPGVYEWFPKKGVKERIQRAVQESAFIVRQEDVDMANEKIYVTREIQMPHEQLEMMKRLEEKFEMETADGLKRTQWVPVKTLWMARLAGGYVDGKKWFENKYKELYSLLKGELSDVPVVVWFRFNAEIEHAAQGCFENGISHRTLTGANEEIERAEIIKRFQTGKFRVLLIQQKLGMYALNLSRASTTIFFSNNYSNEMRSQCEARTEHMLKKEGLLYIDLVTEKSPDEDAVSALARKEKQSDFYLFSRIKEGIIRRTHAA